MKFSTDGQINSCMKHPKALYELVHRTLFIIVLISNISLENIYFRQTEFQILIDANTE